MVLPATFGVRMCLSCPDCNADNTDFLSFTKPQSCSDCVGNNCKLMGGYAGLCTGLAFATEYQGEATPDRHGFVSLCNMYQSKSLAEIGRILESNHHKFSTQDILTRITDFVEHIERQEHINPEEHKQALPILEQEFHHNNYGLVRNIHLSVRPRNMYVAESAPYLWNRHVNSHAQRGVKNNLA